MTHKNVQQVKKQALYLIKTASRKVNVQNAKRQTLDFLREVDAHKAKRHTVDFLGRTTHGAKTQAVKHHKVLAIVGIAVIAKTAFDVIKKSKSSKLACCKGKKKPSRV